MITQTTNVLRHVKYRHKTKKNRRIYGIKERRIVTQRTDRVIKNQAI